MTTSNVECPREFLDMHGKRHIRPEHVKPEWRLSGYALAHNADQKLLLIRPPWSDQYEPPGGALEFGEGPERAAERECYEETGYEVVCDSYPRYILRGTFFVPAGLGQAKKDSYYCTILFFYKARLRSDVQDLNAIRSEEVASTHWVRQYDLRPPQIHPVFRDVLVP